MVNFNQYLINNKIPEYNEYYLDYTLLKNLIKQSDFDEFDKVIQNELTKINDFYKLELINLNHPVNTQAAIDFSFENADKLRQYVLINIIGVIKIIKKRNKNNPVNILNTTDILNKYSFYKCENLILYFNHLTTLSNDNNNIILQKHFENSKALNLLTEYHSFQPSFDGFEQLPFCNSELIKEYLSEKLGETRLNQVIDINTDIDSQDHTDLKTQIQRLFMLLFTLYTFLFGLGLMGDSFKAMSGKSVGNIMTYISNPIAGIMIGIVATVLLQSSSTTTSIVVSMVGADIITVQAAIPVIMGANIGTSVTNTIVSHGHMNNMEEFKRAFAGSTVHDLFNLLSVLVILPINVISEAFGYPLLFNITRSLTGIFANVKADTFKSPIKIIVSPLVKVFLSVNKDVIKGMASGCKECILNNTQYCWDLDKTHCITNHEWDEEINDSTIIKSGLLKSLGDTTGSIVGLIFSLVVLCIAVYYLIKTLQRIVLSGNRNYVMRILQNIMNKSPYLSMLFGMLLTIMVQSSSITTSTFTPLVGLNIITLEQMFPLTLGANIGTTCTAALAALVSGKVNAIQIALCHFIFNIVGIMIWYPIPKMRQIPLNGAIMLGNYITSYKWFGGFYLAYVFILMPLTLWVVSLLFNIQTTIATISGIILTCSILFGSTMLFVKFDNIIKK